MNRRLNYGCCLCQCRHYSGEAIYREHLGHMSKHGYQHSDLYEPYRPESAKSGAEEQSSKRE